MTKNFIQYGRHRKRRSYARISEVHELPNLIEIQTSSYEWFLKEGLKEMFEDISPIEDFTGNLSLEFVDYSLGEPKYPVEEAKERDVTYNAPLRVKVRLLNKETGEVKEQEVFMGDFPLMTDTGTFIINGQSVLSFHNLFVHRVFISARNLIKTVKKDIQLLSSLTVVHG